MYNLFKVELYKLFKDRSVWVILLVLTVCSSISIFTGTYYSADNAFSSLSKDIMPLLFSLSIYSALSLYKEYQYRTVMHYVVSGHKRLLIIISQFVRYFMGCVILMFLYPLLSVVIACCVIGYETTLLALFVRVLKIILMQLPLFISFISLFFMIVIVVQKGVLAMGISVASTIIIVVFTNKLYFSSDTTASPVIELLPTIQLQMISSNVINNKYILSCFVSMMISGILFVLAYKVFNKMEIR